MIRLAITYILLGFVSIVSIVSAQEDPVLMRINGKDIHRSELEYNYNKGGKGSRTGRKVLKEYINLFVDFKLKVAAAEAAGLDTMRVFKKKQEDLRRRLIMPYLTDMEVQEQDARAYYNKLKSGRNTEQVHVEQIFKYLPQNISSYALREMENKMDSIYRLFTQTHTTASFNAFVNRFSDDKRTVWMGRLQMPKEFEEIVFGMQAGEISRPFLTPQGIHVVKVLARRELPPFEEMKHEIILRQTRRYAINRGTQTFVEKLKKEYRYTPNKAGVNELLTKGSTNQTLFTLNGKQYTGKEFTRFATAHPEDVHKQLKSFITKTVLDYENSRLEQKHPELRTMMQAHLDSLLVAEITQREIGERSMKDKAGLVAYFEQHRSDFHWGEPRYKGIVLHCATKRIAKHARKFLKQLPENEWRDAIRLTFNTGGKTQIQAEQGTFAPGDNVYIDHLVFKRKPASPVPSHPFTIVLGKKQKGPDDWQEAGEPLIAAYRDNLEAHWTTKLRADAKVDFDQEVIKTVNNH